MINYDIVICVGWKDVLVVKTAIKYIRKNLCYNNIYLILNKEYFKYFPNKYCNLNKIKTIDENALIEGLTFKNVDEYLKIKDPKLSTGWYFQQFLKIGFAWSKYVDEYYLIWDADTLPLNNICFEYNHKLLFTMKNEYHKPYFDTIKRLWNIDKQIQKSFISEHMLIKSDIMNEMIDNICNHQNRLEWYKIIIDALPLHEPNAFSEFESYGTYVSAYYPNLYFGRTLNTWRNAGLIFGRNIKDKDIEALSVDLDIISLETWCGRIFPDNLFEWFQELRLKMNRYLYIKRNGLRLNNISLKNLFKGRKVIKNNKYEINPQPYFSIFDIISFFI